MRLAWWVCVPILGCGRLNFDEIRPGDGGGVDGASDGGNGPRVCTAWQPPQLVSEVSSPQTDYGPAISADGSRLYLHTGTVSQDIFMATASGGAFGAPVEVANVNTPTFEDSSASTTADELELYLSSNRDGVGSCVYAATRTAATQPFGVPVRLDALCVVDDATGPEISLDGLRLYYTRVISGNEGELMMSVRASRAGAFGLGTPVAGLTVAEVGQPAGFPSLSDDELEIYFETENPFDVWRSVRTSTSMPFEPPQLVGEVNTTTASEVDPDISIDGTTLYFSSNRSGGPGGFDIYRTTRACD